jgi:hypothetical protein
VESNQITVQAAGTSTFGISVTTADRPATFLVMGNSVYVPNGTGLLITAGNDQATRVFVQGNDFSSNAVGIQYTGAGGTTLGSDLGGGATGSLGGNLFNAYTAPASPTNAAIGVSGVAGTAILSARMNVFAVADPTRVVSGSANVDTSNQETGVLALAQFLYVTLLGRAGAHWELEFWGAMFVVAGGGGGPGQPGRKALDFGIRPFRE